MSHNHTHQLKNYNRAFIIGILLNLLFVGIEAGYGVIAASLALIADAGHNFSDVLSLLLAWGASLLAQKAATNRRTFGYRKITIIASAISAILLLMTLGVIIYKAIYRLYFPQPVDSLVIIVVASIGVIINTITALLFFSGQKIDLNIKGAFLHMAADAAISLGVVITGFIIMKTGWLVVDPAISIIVALIILFGTWGLLRDSFNLLVDAVPSNINISKVEEYLISNSSVEKLHDLHVWALSTTETALSVHLIVSVKAINNEFLSEIQKYLHDNFFIAHATIQLETKPGVNVFYDPQC